MYVFFELLSRDDAYLSGVGTRREVATGIYTKGNLYFKAVGLENLCELP